MRLRVKAGPDRGRVIELAEPQVILGRGSEVADSFTDQRISRKHCVIEIANGVVTITDQQSRGGTFINGNQIQSAILKAGDQIRIGDSELCFEAAVADVTMNSASPLLPDRGAEEPKFEELLGETIHRYRLVRVIARGKSGWVFYAKHTQREQELALKLFSPTFTQTKSETQRFVRAMKTMMPIKHPNIVRLHHAGMLNQMCWLAMEFVDGECLTETIRRIGIAGMLPWETALRVGIHLARALEAAAENNIIHRNVCPQSILLQKADRVAKLGDLVLAKALEGLNVKQITRPGELVGDVNYMSPERTGGPEEADTRSDLYGLGATLYALLTGRPPFEDRSLPTLIRKIRQEEPVSPKTFQLSINDLFTGIVMRCLAKRPEDRYQSATALLKDLNRVAQFQGITV